MSNSDNPPNGADFEKKVLGWLEDHYDIEFELQKSISIGNPKADITKPHRFDIAGTDKHIAIECKRYTWTKAGNVPSAKMGFINEAVFYLNCLPDDYQKYIVMLKSYNAKRDLFLSDYYFKTNKHLLGDVKILEYDPENKNMRLL